MGIVNATPDSFSDAGLHRSLEERVALAHTLVADGAAFIDIGGESGVTNRPAVAAAEEIERVVPLIERVCAELDVNVSVDTYKPAVARAAIAAGACLVNDVSGLRDPELADVCAQTGAGLVIMHTRVRPKQKLLDPGFDGRIRADVTSFLAERIAVAVDRGVSEAAARARSRPGLRQDAGADDRRAGGARGSARFRASRPARRIAQGFHRGAHRASAPGASGRHAGRDRAWGGRGGSPAARPRCRRRA